MNRVKLQNIINKNKYKKQIENLAKKCKNKKILIYGTGDLFDLIVNNYDLSEFDIIGITDKKYTLKDDGLYDYGYKIIPYEKINEHNYDVILVSLLKYRSIIKNLKRYNKKNIIMPMLKIFIWFDVEILNLNKKNITFLGCTFTRKLNIWEKILYYLEHEYANLSSNSMPNINLKLYLAKSAAYESANYIVNNLITVKTFEHRLNLLNYALSKTTISGEYLEFGVYKGASINYIATHKPENLIYGFDSFEGLPENWNQYYQKGHFKLEKFPNTRKNVKLIQGWFENTIPDFKQNILGNKQIAFLHCDCDLYSSIKTIFTNLNNNIKSGTIIVFDGYLNYQGWQNNTYKAFQEFIFENNLKYEYIGYVYNSKQVAVRII